MTQHLLDSQTIVLALKILERTWVGVADQDNLFSTINTLQSALATPLNLAPLPSVISSM